MLKSLAALCALLAILAPGHAFANFYFSPEDTVKSIIDKLRAAVDSAIAAAGDEARATMTHGYQLSIPLIESLEVAYVDSMEKTFSQLTDQRKGLLNDADNIIHSLETSKMIDGVKLSADTMIEVISDAVPFANGPLVIDYRPAFVSPRKSDDLRVTVNGSRLGGEEYIDHKLIFGAQEFAADAVESNSLQFVVPRESLPTNYSRTTFERGTLRITRKPSLGQRLFRGKQGESIDFKLLFTVLPSELGTVRVRSVFERVDRITEPYASPKILAQLNGPGIDSKRDCQKPKVGYLFDPRTSDVVVDRFNGRKGRASYPNINIGEVRLDLDTPQQICIVVTAGTGCKECGASTEGHFVAEIYKEETRREFVYHDPIRLAWGRDETIDLNAGALTNTVTVNLFNDIVHTVGAKNISRLPFVSIIPEIEGNLLIVRPDRPWE